MKRIYRDCKLTIQVENPAHVQHGVKTVTVNGEPVDIVNDAYITETILAGCNEACIAVMTG